MRGISVTTRLVTLLALSAAALFGQTGVGTIEGTVKDSTGALMPGVRVKVVNVATSVTREGLTNSAGFYTFPQALIGHYRVTAEAPGMMRWDRELDVITGQTTVVDIDMKVGSSTTEVTVAGEVQPLVVTDSPVTGEVLERARIEQLPLNGRSLNTLMGDTEPGDEGGRVNGLMGGALDVLQDGAVIRNLDTASMDNRPPGLDTIQEFRLETSASSAKYDRPTTAILSTRSGTNGVHGSAFETARNNDIGLARRRQDFFSKAPQLIRNEFGASVGGPVYLPKIYHGRNKTFFFVAYEGYRLAQSTTAPTTVFPAGWEQGNFAGITNGSSQAITIYNPYSTQSQANNWVRAPFPGNQIPVSLESPLAKYLYSVTPVATNPNVNPALGNNFFGTAPNRETDNTTTFRIDHSFSERDHVFGRFSNGTLNSSSPPSSSQGPPTLDGGTNITNRGTRDISATLSWTHAYSPTFFGETLLGANWENYNIYTGDFFKDWSDQLGMPNIFNEIGFPNITGTGANMTFIQGDTRRQNKSLILSLQENMTKVKGRHKIEFGGQIRGDDANVLPDQQYESGAFDFTSSGGTGLYNTASGSAYSAVPLTDFSGADFFLGIANYYRDQLNPKAYHLTGREYAGYVNDTWRVTERLTLILGLRYEYNPPLHDKVGLLQSFDLQNMAIVDGASLSTLYAQGRTTPSTVGAFTNLGVKFETPDQAGMSSGILKPYKDNIGPRVGFAWKAVGDSRPLVIRAGVGLYDYSSPLRDFDASTRTNPPFSANYQNSLTSAAASPDGLPNYALRSVPTLIAGLNSTGAINPNSPSSITPGSFTVVYFDPNYPDTRVANWNFRLEREVLPNTLAEVTYIGTHGWNLDQDYYMNQAPSSYIWYVTTGLPLPTGTYASTATRNLNQTTYGNLEEFGKFGWSNSNSIQLQLEHRYSRGYAFQLFYVLDNAMRAGGNGWHDDVMEDPNVFLPGAVPTSFTQRDRLLFYQRDTGIPKHHVQWNWLLDIPVGRGKKLAGNAGPWVDRLIGGWQLSGIGAWKSNYFSLPTSNWGSFTPVQVYGLKYKIQNCTSGACIPGYLYWNGYIPANQINTHNAAGQCTGICGVPSNYVPSNQPLIPIPATPIPGDPNAPYYGTNDAFVPLKNGTNQLVSYNSNLNPFQNQYVMGPGTFSLDASISKNIRIRESVVLRLQGDFFSVLNNPGLSQPGSNGVLSLQNSANASRTLQLTGRLTW